MWNVIAQGVVQVAVALTCYRLGMERMVMCYVAVNIGWTFVWHWMAWREIRLRLWDALRDTVPFLLIAAGTMGLTGFAVPHATENIYVSFIAKITMAVALYVGLMVVCRVQTFREAWAYFRKKEVKE